MGADTQTAARSVIFGDDMQGRIKELAALAGAVPTNDGLEFGAVELSAFARLIAEECAKVCEGVDMFNYDDPGSTYASAIRARFGIT